MPVCFVSSGFCTDLWIHYNIISGTPNNNCICFIVYRPNARIMLHQPSGGAQGMASDIDIQAREILRTRANLNQLYVKHTKQDLKEIERVMERDFFMDVEQAVEFGVIDSILDKREVNKDDDNMDAA